jgi:hypothetical protein
MIRIYIGLVLIALTALSISCNGEEDKPAFTMAYEMDFDIPAGLNTFVNHVFPKGPLNTSIQNFSGQFPLADIKSIRTIRATVSPVFSNTDFSVIDESIIDIFDPDDSNDLFEAAYTIQVPNRQLSTLELVPSLTNLQEVMIKDKFGLNFEFRLRTISTTNQTWRLRLELGAFE